MGNLIIKPNTGGDLKLQDEGGTDAISISTTGNTTLAGTANSLGTVTAGNLSNTAIVYPADSIVQHKTGMGWTSVLSLADSSSASISQTMTPRSYNTTNGYFMWDINMSAYKNDTSSGDTLRGTLEVSYGGGSYVVQGFSGQYMFYRTSTEIGISTSGLRRQVSVQGSGEHTFRLTLTTAVNTANIYQNTAVWEIKEIYKP